jgi:hypothetical protein
MLHFAGGKMVPSLSNRSMEALQNGFLTDQLQVGIHPRDKFGAPANTETPINSPDRVSHLQNHRAGRTQEGTTMLKKMTLLAMAVAAIAAFAVPASASAATDWTHEGVVVKEGVDLTEAFEGELSFDTAIGSFGCQVTVVLTVTGPTKAEITKFAPTTATCKGTNSLVPCKLKNDASNVPWTVTSGTGAFTVTKTGGNVTVFNEYEAGCPLGASSDLLFEKITVTPATEEGVITKLTISGTSTVGVPATGSVTPEPETTLLGVD